MSDFFNKSSRSFITGFILFVLISIALVIGISSYADAHGYNAGAAVINFFSGK